MSPAVVTVAVAAGALLALRLRRASRERAALLARLEAAARDVRTLQANAGQMRLALLLLDKDVKAVRCKVADTPLSFGGFSRN